MIRFTVDVTAGHITAGEPGEPCSCAVALAVRDAMPFLADPWVEETSVLVDHDADGHAGAWVIRLPDVAVEFISRLDAGDAVEPFSFDLDIPDELIPAGSPS